jgi:hypothetical protein
VYFALVKLCEVSWKFPGEEAYPLPNRLATKLVLKLLGSSNRIVGNAQGITTDMKRFKAEGS